MESTQLHHHLLNNRISKAAQTEEVSNYSQYLLPYSKIFNRIIL